MADPAGEGLPYGDFGQPAYDSEQHLWILERSANDSDALQCFGEPEVVSQATAVDPPAFEADRSTRRSRRREKQVKALANRYPEVQPASALLPNLARVSEAVEVATARHDPCKGSLLAFGTVTDQLYRTTATVAAFTSGPTGSDLRLAQVQKQRRGWDDSKAAWLEVSTVYGDEAIWKGPGVPIQSVVFSRAVEKQHSFLAVRLMTATVLFRPVLRKVPSHAAGSRLDVNFLLELNIEDTGGSPHTDITFNPWLTRQFVVTDQAGKWSAWELEGRESREAKFISRGLSSQTNDGTVGEPNDDGWARVTWVGTPTTIAIFGRTRTRILDIATREGVEADGVNVGADVSFGWFLDMVLLPSRPSYLCVLTSVSLHIYHVSHDREEQLSTKCIVTRRHFKHPGDISLRLRCFAEEDGVLIVLYSGISHLVVTYRLHFEDGNRVTIGHPTELTLPLPLHAGRSGSVNKLLDLYIEPVSLQMPRPETTTRGTGSRYLTQGVQFYSVTTLHGDLALRQHLCCSSTSLARPSKVKPPSWKTKLAQSVTLLPEDDFVVNDDEMEVLNGALSWSEPVAAYVQGRQQQAASRQDNEWTVNFELTAQHLNDFHASEMTIVDALLEDTATTLRNSNADAATQNRTLRELANGELVVRDLEESSNRLLELQSIEPSASQVIKLEDEDEPSLSLARMVLRSVQMPPVSGLPTTEGPGMLSSVHGFVTATWISSLPNDIPEPVQSSRDELARRMTAEIAVAGQVLRLEVPPGEQESQSQYRSRSQPQDLALRPTPGPSFTRSSLSPYRDVSSQPPEINLLTPSRSATPTAATALSTAPEIARLSRYTTFSKPSLQPLPRTLNRVLQHWTPGADPATYDWSTTSHNLSQHFKEEAKGEELTEKERKRMERRTERYVQRQAKEAGESQRQLALSSQVPEIVSASQPQAAARPKADTQQTLGASSQSYGHGLSQQPASQVLPGRHGGRPPPKKKRKSGF